MRVRVCVHACACVSRVSRVSRVVWVGVSRVGGRVADESVRKRYLFQVAVTADRGLCLIAV